GLLVRSCPRRKRPDPRPSPPGTAGVPAGLLTSFCPPREPTDSPISLSASEPPPPAHAISPNGLPSVPSGILLAPNRGRCPPTGSACAPSASPCLPALGAMLPSVGHDRRTRGRTRRTSEAVRKTREQDGPSSGHTQKTRGELASRRGR